jgi:hypothetical protein
VLSSDGFRSSSIDQRSWQCWVVQPGGSNRDPEVITAATNTMAMAFGYFHHQGSSALSGFIAFFSTNHQ